MQVYGARRVTGIVPLGGALVPYVVDPLDLQRELGLPVFNTKSTSIRFAETCHALGLSHSAITYPSAKQTLKKAEAFLTERQVA